MKKSMIKTATFFAVAALFIVALNSCDNGYSAANFGINNVYMPQATVSGGLNQNYPVPVGLDSATHNYQIDSINNKVNVYLGVTVSGEQANLGLTVNVSVNNDTTNQIISGGSIAKAILLPASSYSLPTLVTVPAGKHTASFNLSIDAVALKAYAGKMVLLTVQISDPTNYVLNKLYSRTVVVINVNALNLK